MESEGTKTMPGAIESGENEDVLESIESDANNAISDATESIWEVTRVSIRTESLIS